MEIRIKDEFIKLGQALKLAGVVEDGVEAKYAINGWSGTGERSRWRTAVAARSIQVDTISYDGKEYLCDRVKECTLNPSD